MLKITNKDTTYVLISGHYLAPHKSIKLDLPYTSSLRSLERNGIIAVSEVTIDEPIIIEEQPAELPDEETSETTAEEVAEDSTSGRKRKRK